MKLISFAIPSYNSENYLSHAVDTILSGGEDVEIIIVNDGSSDGTAAIADSYAERYPSIVRAVHKPNGGHGSGVNRGLQEASGLYFKVVDSDDWVDEAALTKLLNTIKTHLSQESEADLYITNYIYDHATDNTQFQRAYRKQMPCERFFGWNDVGSFVGANVLLMHSLLYKTEVLRRSGILLPEHTFYVDNIYAYTPLVHTRKLYYLDVDLYHYFIGRSDQSVNINNFLKRYEQQNRVMESMLSAYTYDEIAQQPKGLRKYLLHDLSAIMMNTILFCCGGNEPERKVAYDGLWTNLKQRDIKLYQYLTMRGLPALVVWMPWRMRKNVMLMGYKVICKFVKLG